MRHVRPWAGLGYSGPDPTICPGYTTNLPETQEIARAHMHWKNGALTAWLQGKAASEALLIGIEHVEAQVNAFEAWSMEEASKSKGAR